MNIIKEFRKRFSKNGEIRVRYTLLKNLKHLHPNSIEIEQILEVQKKQLYAKQGKNFICKHLFEIAKKQTEGGQYLCLDGLSFDIERPNEGAFMEEYIDNYASDLYFSKETQHPILMDILRVFEGEGPYQTAELLLNTSDVVIDAGANMGLFSLLAAHKKDCHIFAFEPYPKALEKLEKHIKINHLSEKITVCPYALSSSNNSAQMEINSDNIGAGSITQGAFQASENSFTIQCVTLDLWAKENNIEKIDFIKADIEGSERLLLQGATRVLKTLHPKLSICTYHLPDDKEVLTKIILEANPNYHISYGKKKLYAHI